MNLDAPLVAKHLWANPKRVLVSAGDFLRKSSLDELPIPQEVALDVEYLQHQSL